MILPILMLAAPDAPAAPVQDAGYSAADAKRDYSRLLLAEGGMLACHRGSDTERRADEALYRPRITAFERRIRARFGDAIPATNRIKVDHDDCNSRKRYENELSRLLDQVEKRAAAMDAPAAPAAPAPTGQ
ncbi:MAG: hypothetical protein V4574_07880 [Pseudomonadota bacterium]